MDIYDSDGLLDRAKVMQEVGLFVSAYNMTPAGRRRLIDLADELADGQTCADEIEGAR